MTRCARRALASSPLLRMLWGHGWFILPNPVYGSGLKGDIDDGIPAGQALDRSRRVAAPAAPATPAAPAAPVTALPRGAKK